MKQQKRLFIVIFLYLALISILLSGCRTKKVAIDIEKSSDKTKTEESTKVKTDIQESTKEKEKTTITTKDSTESKETDETEITADVITKDKDGNLTFKGNAKFKGKKQLNISGKKESRSESLKEASTDKSLKKDSTGKKSEEKNIDTFKKKKDADIRSISWLTIATPMLIVLVIAFIAVRWNWLGALFRRITFFGR